MKLLLNHVEKFIKRANLLSDSKRVVVAVSAGIDSMALLYVMGKLRDQSLINELRAFHINHGTRVENGDEQKLVEKICSQMKISLSTFRLSLDPNNSNFEFIARNRRYELFFANLEEGEILFTAHHLDDSFEWSLLKQMKSGNQKALLGIPVKNGVIRRPFLCVSKTQIKNFVEKNQIVYMDDPSNKNLRFERNYLRKKVIPNLAKKFPNYLKHYVYRSNELAYKMNLSVFGKKPGEFKIQKDNFNGYLVINPSGKNDFTGAQESIRKVIYLLSRENRGTLSTQIEKIIEAAKKGKKGPLIFSGDVLGFIGHDHLYFISKKNLSVYENLDLALLNKLENKEFSFTPKTYDHLKSEKQIKQFPYLVFAPQMPRNFPSLKSPHPLFPKSSHFAIKQGLWCNTYSRLLFQFERSSNIEKNSAFPLFLN